MKGMTFGTSSSKANRGRLPERTEIIKAKLYNHLYYSLPVHDFINNRLLLAAAPAQVDSGGLNAFMSKQIGQKCNITAAFNEIFGKTVTEGVGINHSFVQMVPDCQSLKLPPYAAGRNAHAGMV